MVGPKFVFASSVMKAVLGKVRQVASVDATVMITGESGSGKEVIARLIHEQSGRKKEPFVAVNCASFPGSLMEVELFGYEKGAFTGANQRHRGLFEQAHGGTLLLDEIAELDLGLQAKFLRVLQEKRFRRVGGESEIGVDVRLLASTHRNLKQLVEEGKFREDLFYRISVFPIEVPPLRDRPDDVVALVAQFVEHFNREMGKRVDGISTDARDILVNYAWPGNVRELRNTVERVMILRNDGLIQPEELPIEIITGVERLPDRPPSPSGENIHPPGYILMETGSPPRAGRGGPAKSEPGSRATDQPIDFQEINMDRREPARDFLDDPASLKDLDRQVAKFEKERIRAALKLTEGNQSRAAEILGIRRDTLRFRMKKHRLL